MNRKQTFIQISEKFKSIKNVPRWILHGIAAARQLRLIRIALGMTQKQLAQRVNMQQHAIARVENSANHDIRLGTLRKLAEGLQCELLISVIPKEKISKLIESRASKIAKEKIRHSLGNAAMESQSPDQKTISREIEQLKQEIIKKYRSSLWA
jgi:predicted DNA-binding mobile mystery protein A